MENVIFLNWLTLSLFVAFVGFCFCDGFKLHILRKLIWFVFFLAVVLISLKIKNEFDLTLILPPCIVLAIILCYLQKRQGSK